MMTKNTFLSVLLVTVVVPPVLGATAILLDPVPLPAVQRPTPPDREPELEQYPGQNNHAEPPDGWACEHQNYELSVPPAHVCTCERGCDEQGVMHEDRKCAVYCHADHCHCEVAHRDLCPKQP